MGQVIRGKKGDVIHLPKKIPRAPRTVGSENLQVRVIRVPGDFDHFFAALADRLFAPPSSRRMQGSTTKRI